MREEWKIKPLDELLEIQNGFAFNSKQFSHDGSIPLIRIRDLKSGFYTETSYTGDYDEKYLVKAGDFLIGMDGEFACHEWKGPDALLNQRVCRLQNFVEDLVPRFLYYGINKYLKDIENVTAYATVKHISARQIREIFFPLPPLAEQKRIVAILDEAFEGIDTAIANTEKNLANARELFESELDRLVKGAVEANATIALSELATDITDGDHMPPPKVDEGIPFITISNINKATRAIDFSKTFKVPKDYYKALKSNEKPQNGDVLYTVTGSYGIPVLVDVNVAFCFQRHIGLIRPKIDVSSKWLEYVLLSSFVKAQVDAGATGTAQKTVSLRLLRSLKVPMQNLDDQFQIVSQLDALKEETQRLESIYRQKLTALAELKQSLLQRAFSGELTAEVDREIQEAVA